MPNYVANKLKIYCPDIETINRMKKLLFINDEDCKQIYSMEAFLPRPLAFSEKGNFDLKWNRIFWGTKWDALQSEIILNDDTIIIRYNTAWNPNSIWVQHFCQYIFELADYGNDEKLQSIKVEHRYWELGQSMGGIVEWYVNPHFNYKCYNSCEEYAKQHDLQLYESILKMKCGQNTYVQIKYK